MKLFWASFLLYVPLCYMMNYSTFECPAFLHFDARFGLDSKNRLSQEFTVSYCHATFVEYIYANDRREMEQYIKTNPTKTFYQTILGRMNHSGMILLWVGTITMICLLAFDQLLFILDSIHFKLKKN